MAIPLLRARKTVHLDARQNERPHTFQIVFHDWLADVVIKTAVAIFAIARRTAEAGDGTALDELPVIVAIGLDELGDDAVVAFFNRGNVFARQIIFIHAFRQRIDEHRRRRGFTVIAFAVALVQHLPPKAGLGV